jgi:general secretion pathway protein B
MSYILEALKKAQAERQMGEAPSIHAPQVVAVTASPTARGKPLLVVVAVAVVAALAAAGLVWRHQAPPQVASTDVANAHAPGLPPAVAPTTIAPPPVASTTSVPPPVAPHDSAARAPAAVAVNVTPTPPPPPPERVAAAPTHRAAPADKVAPRSGAATVREDAAPAPASAPPPAAEYVRTLGELPEAIRREVPKVSFSGYMYSPDAADRLVLVDKTLRHEGEEVAPGLRLEKLLPKSAVLSYKGYQFRVGL